MILNNIFVAILSVIVNINLICSDEASLASEASGKKEVINFNKSLDLIKANNIELYHSLHAFKAKDLSESTLKLLSNKLKDATSDNIDQIIDEMDQLDPNWIDLKKESLEFLKDPKEKKRTYLLSLLIYIQKNLKRQRERLESETEEDKKPRRVLNDNTTYVLPPPDPPISWSPETDNWVIDIFTIPFDDRYQYNPRTPFVNQTTIDAWENTVESVASTIMINFTHNWKLYYNDWDYDTNPDDYKWYEQCHDYQYSEYLWIKNGTFQNRTCDHYGAWVSPNELKCSCNHGEVLNALWCCPVNWQCIHTIAYMGQCFPSIEYLMNNVSSGQVTIIGGFSYFYETDTTFRQFFYYPNWGNETPEVYWTIFF